MTIVNSYRYNLPTPKEALPTVRVAVLTRDACGQYVVYVAANCTDSFCADRGIKSNYRRALLDFPDLKENEYRA